MKVNYMYVPTIEGAQPVTVQAFVKINRQIEALQYLQWLRFGKGNDLFKEAVERAIDHSISSFSEIDINIPDFYGSLEYNILAEIASALEMDDLEYDDLTDLKWWKIVASIPITESDLGRTSTTTIAVDDPIEECRRLLTDLEPKK